MRAIYRSFPSLLRPKNHAEIAEALFQFLGEPSNGGWRSAFAGQKQCFHTGGGPSRGFGGESVEAAPNHRFGLVIEACDAGARIKRVIVHARCSGRARKLLDEAKDMTELRDLPPGVDRNAHFITVGLVPHCLAALAPARLKKR